MFISLCLELLETCIKCWLCHWDRNLPSLPMPAQWPLQQTKADFQPLAASLFLLIPTAPHCKVLTPRSLPLSRSPSFPTVQVPIPYHWIPYWPSASISWLHGGLCQQIISRTMQTSHLTPSAWQTLSCCCFCFPAAHQTSCSYFSIKEDVISTMTGATAEVSAEVLPCYLLWWAFPCMPPLLALAPSRKKRNQMFTGMCAHICVHT